MALLEGVLAIEAPLLALGLDRDPDWIILRGVASEIDHLPFGAARAHWDPEALRAKDEEIGKHEATYRRDILAACQRIIARLSAPEDCG